MFVKTAVKSATAIRIVFLIKVYVQNVKMRAISWVWIFH